MLNKFIEIARLKAIMISPNSQATFVEGYRQGLIEGITTARQTLEGLALKTTTSVQMTQALKMISEMLGSLIEEETNVHNEEASTKEADHQKID